jgi:hypothetical protein
MRNGCTVLLDGAECLDTCMWSVVVMIEYATDTAYLMNHCQSQQLACSYNPGYHPLFDVLSQRFVSQMIGRSNAPIASMYYRALETMQIRSIRF